MADMTDWSLFRFPPPPSKRRGTLAEQPLTPAPQWASPPSPVTSWHLDDETFFIVHPVQRKKIDLNRVLNKRRLVKLCDILKTQHDPVDLSSLWRALDSACQVAFGMSLSETLAFGPEEWEWPSSDHFMTQPHMFDEDSQHQVVGHGAGQTMDQGLDISFPPSLGETADALLSGQEASGDPVASASSSLSDSVPNASDVNKAISLEDLPEESSILPSP